MSKTAEFTSQLKKNIRTWLESEGLKQVQLAQIMKLTPSAVSNNLHTDLPMSEGFISRLSETIPEWADAYIKYLEIKGGAAPAPELQNAAKQKKTRAKKVKSLLAAQEEVIKGIRALTAAAIEVLDEND